MVSIFLVPRCLYRIINLSNITLSIICYTITLSFPTKVVKSHDYPLNAGRLLRLSHRITIYTPIEFSCIQSQLFHKLFFPPFESTCNTMYFPNSSLSQNTFFFSLQKIFICRVAKEIANVRENTYLSIDSKKSYPISSSGTTFLPSAI